MNYESKYNELVEAARAVVEGNPGLCKTDEGLGRLSKLLPEKESEDERIRKEIVDYFSQFKDDGLRGVDITPWIAYLEKQKDAIGAARQQGYEEGLEDGIKMNMAEQMGESKEWADELSAEIDRISKRYPEVSFAKLSRVAVHFVRWQKEQKPFSQEVFDIAKHEALWGEQPPAEWSEEDEEHIESLLERLDGMCKKDATFTPTRFAVSEDMDWLKSLSERFELQPKQKWSEEDEKKLRTVISLMKASSAVDPFYDKMCLEGWLELLPERINCQPKQEWGEEDEKIRQSLINDLENAETEDEGVQKELNEDVAWLKSLRPQPHWKPSEEQLSALSDVLEESKGSRLAVLKDLYNRIKEV